MNKREKSGQQATFEAARGKEPFCRLEPRLDRVDREERNINSQPGDASAGQAYHRAAVRHGCGLEENCSMAKTEHD
jgi:hypothetical protein